MIIIFLHLINFSLGEECCFTLDDPNHWTKICETERCSDYRHVTREVNGKPATKENRWWGSTVLFNCEGTLIHLLDGPVHRSRPYKKNSNQSCANLASNDFNVFLRSWTEIF